MILSKIKKLISDNIGVKHKFVFHGTRNQNEEFFGIITKVFPAIFLIELDNGQIKAYSYNDFLIGNLEIID